jgi:hypothetical protein
MMENVLFIREEGEILKHYDLSPLENVFFFLATTQHLNVYILAVILFTFIAFFSHFYRFLWSITLNSPHKHLPARAAARDGCRAREKESSLT